MAFLPCGLVTLTTDLGLADPSVGIMKGVMLSRFAQLKIVDLCHYVPPQDVSWASYAIAGSYRDFPPGTVHCAVVAPGVGTRRGILVAERGGHAFVAPDNGILTRVLGEGGSVYRLDLDRVPVAPVRRTFHTRDIIAPIGALLAGGKLAVEDCGDAEPEPKLLRAWPAEVTEDTVRGVVLGEDRFGNLHTSLTEGDIPDGFGKFVVEIGEHRLPTVGSYAEVEPGQALALFNAFGMLELAIRDGKATSELAWERGTPLTVRRA